MNLDIERVDLRTAWAITGLHAKGENPERIAETLGVQAATVQQVLMLHRFGLTPELRVVARPVSDATGDKLRTTRKQRFRVQGEVSRVQAPARHPSPMHALQANAKIRQRTVKKLSDVLEGYLNQEESEK